MANYIDGFVFPIQKKYLDEYHIVATEVASIWKEYGAISYLEFVGDDLNYEGTKSFEEVLELNEGEVAILGWVVFPSKEIRDKANQMVPLDKRMEDLVAPLTDPNRLVFNSNRMIYGGFKPLVS